MSVVALRLVGLREQVRHQPQRPADEAGLDKLTLAVLRRTAHHPPVQAVADVALAIGRLGGHLNRHHDGLPGWQTLWCGLQRLSCSWTAFAYHVSCPDLGEDKGFAGGCLLNPFSYRLLAGIPITLSKESK